MPDEPKKWNPRYVAYAVSQCRGPQEQIDYDFADEPNRCRMAGFMVWMSKRIAEFKKLYPDNIPELAVQQHPEEFDNYLFDCAVKDEGAAP
jgi:hypothetical protein